MQVLQHDNSIVRNLSQKSYTFSASLNFCLSYNYFSATFLDTIEVVTSIHQTRSQAPAEEKMILKLFFLALWLIHGHEAFDIMSYLHTNCSVPKKPGRINLCEIPDILSGLGSPLIATAMMHPTFFGFRGSTPTRACLKDKNLLFLGDSTMAEAMDDIVILLSGIGRNASVLDPYLFESSQTTHVPHPPYKRIDLPNNITVEYFGGRRNMTITSNVLGLHIRFRFIGHHKLFQNYGGILTFFHPDFAAELACLLGGNGCLRPSVIVLNSGLHDARGHNNATTFAFHLNKLFAKLKVLPATRVIWKSNVITDEIVKKNINLPVFDALASSMALKWNVIYVNSTLAYEIVADGAPHLLQKTSTDHFLHIGSVAKDKFHRDKRHRKPYSWHSLAMSSLATQLLLRQICRWCVSYAFVCSIQMEWQWLGNDEK